MPATNTLAQSKSANPAGHEATKDELDAEQGLMVVAPEVDIESTKSGGNKRGVYHVVVADPEMGTVIWEAKFVTDSEKMAKELAIAGGNLIKGNKTADDYDYGIEMLMPVRDPKPNQPMPSIENTNVKL